MEQSPCSTSFNIFKRLKLQRYIIFDFLSVEDPKRSLVVPNFSIFAYIRPQPYFILKISK